MPNLCFLFFSPFELSELTTSDKKIGGKKIAVRPFEIFSQLGNRLPGCYFLVHNLLVYFSAIQGVLARACIIARGVARIK
jgi:hypothetical protein